MGQLGGHTAGPYPAPPAHVRVQGIHTHCRAYTHTAGHTHTLQGIHTHCRAYTHMLSWEYGWSSIGHIAMETE
jgi:hypothetical protein